jgi:hypothetical protein
MNTFEDPRQMGLIGEARLKNTVQRPARSPVAGVNPRGR